MSKRVFLLVGVEQPRTGPDYCWPISFRFARSGELVSGAQIAEPATERHGVDKFWSSRRGEFEGDDRDRR